MKTAYVLYQGKNIFLIARNTSLTKFDKIPDSKEYESV